MPKRKFTSNKEIIYKYVGGRNRPGKFVACPSCLSKRWVSLDNLSRSRDCLNCKRNSVTCICPTCQKVFTKPISRRQKFCSRECSDIPIRLEMIHCKHCNKHFQPQGSKTKYCSRTGYLDSKLNRIPKTCETCHKGFWVIPSNVKRRFCSLACRNQKGQNNPNFRNGLHINRPFPYPYGGKWPIIRKWILERDNHQCQYPRCGKSVTLQVHHKIKFSKFKSKSEANSQENLITLCGLHHRELEKSA